MHVLIIFIETLILKQCYLFIFVCFYKDPTKEVFEIHVNDIPYYFENNRLPYSWKSVYLYNVVGSIYLHYKYGFKTRFSLIFSVLKPVWFIFYSEYTKTIIKFVFLNSELNLLLIEKIHGKSCNEHAYYGYYLVLLKSKKIF